MKIGDQVFRAVLNTGATLSIVARRLLKTFKKTKTVAIRVGDGRTIHSLGGGRCDYIPLATTRRTHSTKICRVFAFMIVLCFRGVFEGARRNGTICLAQFNHFRGEKHNYLLPLPLSWCYACCVCCASCVSRSGASDSASGSLPTCSTRSAGAKRFTPIIPPPNFFLPCFHPCTLPHTCTDSGWN